MKIIRIFVAWILKCLKDRFGFPFIFGIRKMRIIWERFNDVKVNSQWSQDIYSIWFTTSCRSSKTLRNPKRIDEWISWMIFHYCWWFRNPASTTWDVQNSRKKWDKLPFPQLVSLPDCWTINSMSSHLPSCHVFQNPVPWNFTKIHPMLVHLMESWGKKCKQNPPRMLQKKLNIFSQKLHVLNLIPLLKANKSSDTPPEI